MASSGEAMYLTNSFISNARKQYSQQPLVLAVEDHEDSLLLISYALESIGCRFICQKDSSATVLVAKEYQPDLIMLDILLPTLNGLEVVRQLKQEALTKHIPVVAVTALATRENQKAIMGAGFDEYLCKPYMIEELEAVIQKILSGNFHRNSAYQLCQE
ncbi:MAG TPA: response regulator [Leptolyngbyaceae cyanobacterium]